MDEVVTFLKGKKTYLVLALAAIIWYLDAAGIIADGSFESALPVLGIAGGSTLVAKFNRLGGQASKPSDG